jgi:hypothetical protein
MGKRISTLTVLTLFSLAAQAQPPQCGDGKPQHADLFTYEQWQAVLNEKGDGDPVLEEAIAAEKARSQDNAVAKVDPIKVEWAQARKLVLLGAIQEVIESLNKSVMLVSVLGRRYATKEPRLSEILRVADAVDPCSIYIRRILE